MIKSSDRNEFSAINGLYEVYNIVDGFFRAGLVDRDGRVVIPCRYTNIQYVSPNWAIGNLTAKSDEEDAEFSSGDEKYAVIKSDFYSIDTISGAVTLAGSLDRAAFDTPTSLFKSVILFPDHLIIKDRSDRWNTYDKNFQTVQTDLPFDRSDLQQGYYHNTGNGEVCYLPTGEVLFKTRFNCEGWLSDGRNMLFVYESRNSPESYKALWDIHSKTLIDLTNHAFSTFSSMLSGFEEGYALIQNAQDKSGLFDHSCQIVIPCEYDKIGRSVTGVNTRQWYFNDGYCAVSSGDMFGYVNARGEVTCPVKYPFRAAQIYSHFAVLTGLDGSNMIVSSEGGLLDLSFSDIDLQYRSYKDNQLIKVKDNSGKWGVIDWQGNTVVGFKCSAADKIYINDFATLVYADDDDFTRTVYVFDNYASRESQN